MAGSIISDIAKDHLIFYADVPNSKFYPGGSACYSLLTGYPGTLENSVGVTGSTYVKSFEFDGTDDYVNFPNTTYSSSVSPEPPAAFDFWIYVDPTCPANGGVFSSSWDSNTYYGYSIQITNNGSAFSINTSYGDGIGLGVNNRRTFITPFSFPFNTWNHIVISIEGSSSAKYYLNTELLTGITITGGYLGTAQFGTNLDSRMGKAWRSTGPNFKGMISNFKFYHRALTELDVKRNYEAHQKRYI